MLRYQNMVLQMKDYDGNVFNVKQVTKTTANKVFNSNGLVWLHPCNMRICNSGWQFPCCISKEKSYYVNDANAFTITVNNYKHYNCNHERGKYPIFFVKVD